MKKTEGNPEQRTTTMRCVLDSSFFFADYPADGECYTTPSVIEELLDFKSKCRFDLLRERGLQVQEPGNEERERVVTAAKKSGDISVISDTDRDVLALAIGLKATIFTDDFALQNVAHVLGIPVKPLQQRPAQRRIWKFRCTGCGRYSDTDGECPVCGSPIKRKLK